MTPYALAKTLKVDDLIEAIPIEGEKYSARVASLTTTVGEILIALTPCHRKNSIKRGYSVLRLDAIKPSLLSLKIVGNESATTYLKNILPKGLPK